MLPRLFPVGGSCKRADFSLLVWGFLVFVFASAITLILACHAELWLLTVSLGACTIYYGGALVLLCPPA